MPRSFPLEDIRNIAFIAHIDAGKTTVTERILYYTGRTYKIGEVHEGTAVMDWMDQERESGHHHYLRGDHLHVEEPPYQHHRYSRHVDFTAEVERSLRVLDGASLFLTPLPASRPSRRPSGDRRTATMYPGYALSTRWTGSAPIFYRTVSMITERLPGQTAAVQYPLGKEEDFRGVVDLVTGTAWQFSASWSPARWR